MLSLLKKDRDFFDSLFDEFRVAPFGNDVSMRTDIKESEHGYELAIEMPGFDKADVKVSLDNGYLLVEAERKHESNDDDPKGKFIRRERYYGVMRRSFYVGDIHMDELKGSFDKGFLRIQIPKEAKKVETKKYLQLE